jgi:sporulation protein YqfC
MPQKGKGRRRKNNEESKPELKSRVTELLDLPKEVVLNIPKLTLLGDGELVIENYKGVIEYDTERVRVNTGSGVIKITGERLMIKEITSEDIMVNGKIKSLEFIT